MSPKAKITLIIGGVIAFFLGWVVFVVSLLDNSGNAKTDIIGNKFKKEQKIEYNKNIDRKNNDNKVENNTGSKQEIKQEEKKEKHSFVLLTPSNLNDTKAWKLFNMKYNKATGGDFKIKYFSDLDKYKEKLIYLLATNNTDFDFAIIPSEWYQNTEQFSKLSFKLPNATFPISSIFDYNFNYYLKDNKIKAIPFAIDPIIGYTLDKEIDTKLNFDSWKRIILDTTNRLSKNGKLLSMPILLGYDENYLKYIEKNNKTYFPIFDYILSYYVFKKDRTAIELIKDFGTNITYKTFDFNLYKKNIFKLKKTSICKGKYEKYCLLFAKKTKLVYGLSSDLNYLRNNQLKIYKKFKLRYKNIKHTTLAIGVSSEYPVRGWIIIINPKSKNFKYMGYFLKTYINLGKKGELPFYRYMISPFLGENQIKNKRLKYLENYIGRFITFDKFNINMDTIITKKILNYLKGDISLEILLK